MGARWAILSILEVMFSHRLTSDDGQNGQDGRFF